MGKPIIKYPKKIDLRLDENLYERIDRIVFALGAKRGSLVRTWIEEKVNEIEGDLEEAYDEAVKGD